MLLDNYWKYRNGVESVVYKSAAEFVSGFIDLEGNQTQMLVNSATPGIRQVVIQDKTLLDLSGVILGSGTTEPQLSDYCLADQIQTLSNLSYTFNTVIDEDGKYTKNLVITGANLTNDNIEVNEWGFTKVIQTVDSPTFSGKTIMLVREVLTTPIVLEANKGFSITIEWAEQ